MLAKIGRAIEWLLIVACLGVIIALDSLHRWLERRERTKRDVAK